MAFRKKTYSRKSRRRGSRRNKKTYGGNILDWFRGTPADTSKLPACPTAGSASTAGSVPAYTPPPTSSDYASSPPPPQQISNASTSQGPNYDSGSGFNPEYKYDKDDKYDDQSSPTSYSSPQMTGGTRHKKRKTKRSSRKHRGHKSSKRRHSSR
jgi:hypothetical protein